MVNFKQMLGLGLLSVGVLVVIYSLQEVVSVFSLIVGIALSVVGLGIALWANR